MLKTNPIFAFKHTLTINVDLNGGEYYFITAQLLMLFISPWKRGGRVSVACKCFK